MERINWSPERVKQIDDYRKNKNVTLQVAAKDLKFSQAAYYSYRSKQGISSKTKPTRKYTRRAQAPMTLELAAPTGNNRIVIMVATRDNFKSILNEVL